MTEQAIRQIDEKPLSTHGRTIHRVIFGNDDADASGVGPPFESSCVEYKVVGGSCIRGRGRSGMERDPNAED